MDGYWKINVVPGYGRIARLFTPSHCPVARLSARVASEPSPTTTMVVPLATIPDATSPKATGMSFNFLRRGAFEFCKGPLLQSIKRGEVGTVPAIDGIHASLLGALKAQLQTSKVYRLPCIAKKRNMEFFSSFPFIKYLRIQRASI